MIISRCKQVSRLGLILLAHLPVRTDSGFRTCFRPLHGYWDSPELSSVFLWRGFWEPRRASLRRYTGYSFVGIIILSGNMNVNSFLEPVAPKEQKNNGLSGVRSDGRTDWSGTKDRQALISACLC